MAYKKGENLPYLQRNKNRHTILETGYRIHGLTTMSKREVRPYVIWHHREYPSCEKDPVDTEVPKIILKVPLVLVNVENLVSIISKQKKPTTRLSSSWH